ncbi:YihY/virulence factor BrkB family protein [Corynebacterium kefirresidentii]|uniref:YihY/virulence factor BrkB family protein n=1 Tax=Corynebacterium kefirresidentii TaxID=1979527 RepID=UPI00265511AB|nr:YihY/virulence factor BrkB family protein [Corynebacterium kefirresidentii]MDN8633302.1 YihY/virulence factor BrkB family protein [Corynebacterium kefirresidentii]
MSTLDDSAEVPGAASTAADDLSAGDPSANARPSASATPVSESVYEGADKIVPSTAPTVVKIEGHTEDVDPLARGNRLRRESWGLVLRRVWADFFHDALMDRAATMTYFTLMAFAPTVLAAYSIATLIFSSRSAEVHELTSQFIADYVPSSMTEQAEHLVGSIIGSTAQGTFALVVSVLVSLFAASAYVRAFSRTANTVYGRVEGRGIIRIWALMWGLTIVLVIGAVIVLFANLLRDTIVSGVVEPLAGKLDMQDTADFLGGIFMPVWNWLRFPLTVVVVLTLIAILYHFSPNVRPARFRWITLGSVVALSTNVVVWGAFALYTQRFAGASVYGAFSLIMAVFMAVWLSNTMLILGIKIDAEVLRAKELQLGLHAARHIQAPPRSDVAAKSQARAQHDLEERSERIYKQAVRRAENDAD